MTKLPIVVLLLLMLASCESEQLTTTTPATRTLEILPKSLEGEQYTPYTFKAYVTNMPIHDPVYYWDFDEGKGMHEQSWRVDTIFYQNKIHYVRVKAVDAITDELLGYDSIRVDIRPPLAFVEMSPKNSDTVLAMNSNGTLAGWMNFSVRSSTPAHLLKTKWTFSDGHTSDVLAQHTNQHVFPRVGTYTVSVDVWDLNDAYLGSDTTTVTIRYPPITIASLSDARSVAIELVIDSSHQIMTDEFFRNPLGIQLDRTVLGVSLDTRINTLEYRNQQLIFQLPLYAYDTVTIRTASDMHSLEEVRVAVNDSGRITGGASPTDRLTYSFTMRDLELIAVTDKKIVFRTVASQLSDFAEDLRFWATLTNMTRITGVHTSLTSEQKAGPYGLVVFVR